MLRQVSLYFLFRAGNGVVALLSLMLLTRWLTPEQYGRYALGISTANVISALGFQWLNVSVGRFYSSRSISPARLLEAAHRYAAGVSAIVLVGAIALAGSALPIHTTPTFIFATAALGVALGFHNLHMQFLNAQQNTLRYGWLTASRAWLALALALGAIWYGWQATGALAGVAIGSVAAILMWGVRRQGLSAVDSDTAEQNIGGKLLRFGLPLSLNFLAIVALDTVDRFMLNHWHGPAAVGAYGAAFDLIQQTMGATLNVLYLAAYPRVVAAWEQGGTEAAKSALRPLRSAMLVVAPLAVLLFASLSSDIAHLVLGANVASQSAEVMLPVALAVAFSGMRAFCFDIALHLHQSTRMQVVMAALMAGVNVVLNILLIPRFGPAGAAWASAVAFGCGMVISLWFGRSDRLFAGIGAELAAAVLAGGLAWLAASALPTVFVAAAAAALAKALVLMLVFLATFHAARRLMGRHA
ncbi:lipopolysaccharide biosynthesis protein [Roseateles sp. NT4]|uniref:lipopolysaccharide biosynthesis protein n=1 Tax=Roseateles sp. NT4 TaxID=3453715 RepID=UPI003EEA201F